jgi:hypothetical protein
MSGPFERTVRIIDQDFSPGSEKKEILSIELLPGGFSFAILDAPLFKYQALLSVLLNDKERDLCGVSRFKTLDPEIRELLEKDYLKTTIACFTPQLTLLPNEVFLQEDQEAMHRFSCTVPPDHVIRIDRMNNMQGYGVYSLPATLLKELEDEFADHRLWHAGSVLIENTLATARIENWPGDIVLHIRQHYFELLLLDRKRLVYYNAFRYNQFDDLMYFLFYVLEQFELDPKSSWAILIGEIAMDSPGFSTLASYFGKVSFTARNDAYKYSPEFEAYPHHYFFNLLNLNFCG